MYHHVCRYSVCVVHIHVHVLVCVSCIYCIMLFSRKDLNPLYVMCAGSIAGVLDWGYSIVPDTLKSRIQTGKILTGP